MGVIRHHAIVVTSWRDESVEAAHAQAMTVFKTTSNWVTDPTPATINGYRSFMVAPDGSKEGWGDSDTADAAREQFIAWLRDASCVDWAEVNYGGDDRDMVGVRSDHGRLWGKADDDLEADDERLEGMAGL